MNKNAAVKSILTNCSAKQKNEWGFAFAPANIALCKYWGKRDEELNLPITSSLSLAIAGKGAFTRIRHAKAADRYYLNGEQIAMQSRFAARLKKFLNLFRANPEVHFHVETELNIPLSAGMASSACGFAALVLALNNLYDWGLNKEKLSVLARLGSGSACRSLWSGFVEWHAGNRDDGMDSFGSPLPHVWEDLRLGLLVLSQQEKEVSSREAMRLTVQNSPLYSVWPEQAAKDLDLLKQAISANDFELFGKVSEANAMLMHEMMLSQEPPINYFLPETHAAIHLLNKLRNAGLQVYFTQDAGPNLQLLFLEQDTQNIKEFFPNVEIIAPFLHGAPEHVVLVDKKDNVIGISDKIQAHLSGKLHRAFSIFILRQSQGDIEILLQKRNDDKYHSGGLWTNTCCGHPRYNEDITAAARRRLREEMGLSADLEYLGFFHYDLPVGEKLRENEIDHVFIGVADIENPPLNFEEAQDHRWITLRRLKQDLADHREKYTPWLPMALDLLLDKIRNL